MGKLDGKVAIVTGGGRGIGRAIAEAYAREGACVAVTAAREREEVEAFVSAWGPGRALAIVADVADSAACGRVVAETVARYGQLDVLVNNAGRGMQHVSAVFLASDEGRQLTGRRLIATEWSPQHADGRPAASGIGVQQT